MDPTEIQQLQLAQQNMQTILAQKQQLQNQIIEFDSALKELEDTKSAYKIVGKIMIAASQKRLTAELGEKKEVVQIRLKNFIQQEEKLKENIEKLQKEAVQKLKEK